MTLYRALFYEPGHFHAALTLRTPNPRLAPDIHVYATPGPERDAFLTLVERFNTRADASDPLAPASARRRAPAAARRRGGAWRLCGGGRAQ